MLDITDNMPRGTKGCEDSVQKTVAVKLGMRKPGRRPAFANRVKIDMLLKWQASGMR